MGLPFYFMRTKNIAFFLYHSYFRLIASVTFSLFDFFLLRRKGFVDSEHFNCSYDSYKRGINSFFLPLFKSEEERMTEFGSNDQTHNNPRIEAFLIAFEKNKLYNNKKKFT